MTAEGTNLDTYHQVVIPFLFLSTWLHKASPSNHMQILYSSIEMTPDLVSCPSLA